MHRIENIVTLLQRVLTKVTYLQISLKKNKNNKTIFDFDPTKNYDPTG